MLLKDRRIAHVRGQAAAAEAITERLGKLHGFAFDPSKHGEQPATSAPKTDAGVIDFKSVNERYLVD